MRIETRAGRYVADIIVTGPTGKLRKRAYVPKEITSASGAKRWAETRARHLAYHGEEPEEVPAPTLREFGPRWIKEYARANGNKPSTIAAKETILRLHLYPMLGSLRLDAIGEAEIQRLKFGLSDLQDKTKACVLSVLATLLRTAERWNEIAKAPHIDVGRWQQPEMSFYDFEEWEALIDGARRVGPMVHVAILLGGDAGLRRGELVAVEQADVRGGAVVVCRNEWEGRVGSPKGGQSRRIPLTPRLAEAIDAIRHLRGKRLLWQADGKPVKVTTLQSWLEVACKRAGLPESRNLHKLRHTFCSHLAMRGATPGSIRELAGHADLKTTQRYMHLSPAHLEEAIALLARGAGVERGPAKGRK